MNDKGENTMNRERIMNDLQKKLQIVEECGYTVIYLALQGSQNYKLDKNDGNYHSDIDTKCFVLPNSEKIFSGEALTSKTIIMEDDSHIDVKDIRLLPTLLSKENPSFLELFFTDYYLPCKMSKYFKELFELRHDFETLNRSKLHSAIVGTAMEKKHALCHRYPAKIEVIDNYGYDPKQLSHMKRLEVMQKDIFENDITFGEAVKIPNDTDREIIADYKFNIMSKEDAVKISEEIGEKMLIAKEKYKSENKDELNLILLEKIEHTVRNIVVQQVKRVVLKQMLNELA